ncbi:MAG: adenylyltransferase/cytidyltransferase family protein [Chitinophagales bacterium]|nr:adenylyltransferase/cytidyltransferase family protein [Chitinophagales bacterium]
MQHPDTSKIIHDVDAFLEHLDRNDKSIIFTNGCFDLLHEGHLHLIAESKKLGDILIVAVNDDASIQRLKGATRPIERLETRMNHLAALETVDYIISFSEDTPLQIIEKIQPDILVKGGDYKKEEVVGNHIARKTVIIPLLEGFSTTKIIQSK